MLNYKLQLTDKQLKEEEFQLVGDSEIIKTPPAGGAMRRAHFIDPVSVIIAATAAVLAECIVDHWLRSKEEGVQIDLNSHPPLVSRIAGVPFGFVMVIHPDKRIENLKLDYDNKSSMKEILAAYLSGKGVQA